MKKRLISIFLAAAMLSVMLPFSAFPVLAETDGFLTYTVEDEKATIVGCDKTISGSFEIPSVLGGYPVVEISVCAFQNCSALTAVKVPDSVIYIGDWVFQNCVNLAEIDLPDSLQVLGTEVFKNTAFYNDADNWVDGVLYLDQYLIRMDLSYSGELAVREGTTHIADFACDFSEMGESGVTKVFLPETLRIIGCYSFWFCGMSEINLPEGLEKIGDGALMNCANLEEIHIPASVKSIGELNFQWCPNLASINVAKENPSYSSFQGALYNKEQTHLIKCPEAKESLVISEGVISLESKAFRGCRALVFVVIPKSVASISENVFNHSTALEQIYYMGSEKDHGQMEIHEVNDILFSADWKDLYADISVSHWACSSVVFCYRNGLMVGTSENAFSPNTTMTRGQIVTILYSLEGKPAISGDSGFSDIPVDAWYKDAVTWASQNGVVNGVGNGKFAPEDPATRGELATMLYAYARHSGGDLSASADLSGFPDYANLGWEKPYMEWAVAKGLISGNSINGVVKIDANGQATRAQGAVIMRNFCEI